MPSQHPTLRYLTSPLAEDIPKDLFRLFECFDLFLETVGSIEVLRADDTRGMAFAVGLVETRMRPVANGRWTDAFYIARPTLDMAERAATKAAPTVGLMGAGT